MARERFETAGGGGMPLCSPGDTLQEFDETYFIAPPKPIPDLGDLVLSGLQDPNLDPGKSYGIALTSNGLAVGSSVNFAERGLYELCVRLERTGRPLSLVCKLTLPEYDLHLESPFDFDEDTLQSDPMRRYKGLTNVWKSSVQGEPYVLFVPKDAQMLSLPRFSIHSQIGGER